MVRVRVPKFLEREKENEYYAVEADRRAKLENINLKEKSPYFYQVYSNVYRMFESSPYILEPALLHSILASRTSSIISRAATHQDDTHAESKFHAYTDIERSLFRVMRRVNFEYEKWECRKF